MVQMLCDCLTLVLASISCLQAHHPPPPKVFMVPSPAVTRRRTDWKLAIAEGQAHILRALRERPR